jgi:hypothetical protein
MIVVEPVGYFCIPGSCSTMSCVVFPVMTHSLTGLTRKENGMLTRPLNIKTDTSHLPGPVLLLLSSDVNMANLQLVEGLRPHAIHIEQIPWQYPAAAQGAWTTSVIRPSCQPPADSSVPYLKLQITPHLTPSTCPSLQLH